MHAIPTNYKGINFRSRLEAQWAAFFDQCEWKWEYGPIDFNGWIPGFAIYGKNEIIYVEIKPVASFPQDVADKIDRSGCKNEVLIVGQVIPIQCEYPYDAYFGWLREVWNVEEKDTWGWAEAALGYWEKANGKIGFCHAQGVFRDRISGGYDGGCWGNGQVITESSGYYIDEIDLERIIQEKWADAKNEVQWKAVAIK